MTAFKERFQPTCFASRGDRIIYALAALVTGIVALTFLTEGNLLCGIPASVCTTFMVIGAATGWCPTQLLSMRKQTRVEKSSLPVPEVSGFINLKRK